MTEDRPYRAALSGSHALREIVRNKGIQFDPDVADALIRGLVAQGIVSGVDVVEARKSS
jgi:HD-GYP domain-containing protein (c-di-GMP phosphodiesterase class II)